MTMQGRKVDRRTERAEIAIELITRDHEEALFAARVQDGTIRIVRCLEGGLVVEAHQVASALNYAALRHRRQRMNGGAA